MYPGLLDIKTWIRYATAARKQTHTLFIPMRTEKRTLSDPCKAYPTSVAPAPQNRTRAPSDLMILTRASQVPRYSTPGGAHCILVLMTSRGTAAVCEIAAQIPPATK